MDLINKHKQEEMSGESKHSLLKLAEISILLDSYDSIFYDFDLSPYSERTLSDDWLLEVIKY